MAVKINNTILFNLTIFIISCVALTLSILSFLKQCNSNFKNLKRLGNNEECPVFIFENGTVFDIKINDKKGQGIDGCGDLNPPLGNDITISPEGSWDYFIGSWGIIEIFLENKLLGNITWNLSDNEKYLKIGSNINDDKNNGCTWADYPVGVGPADKYFEIKYKGYDSVKQLPILRLICNDCKRVSCSIDSVWSVDDQAWYADYNREQFSTEDDNTILIQQPINEGGRLFLGKGPGVNINWTPQNCEWAVTGQWQIDIQLNHQDKDGWCETFYLAGRNQKGKPDLQECQTYADGQDGNTTEIDICETTWGGCKGHTTNILNFGGPGKSGKTICAEGPSKSGVWMTVGARVTSNTVQIYYKLPDEQLIITNQFTTDGEHKHQLIPYLGTWCIVKEDDQKHCKNKDNFFTKWRNYKYSPKIDGDLVLLN